MHLIEDKFESPSFQIYLRSKNVRPPLFQRALGGADRTRLANFMPRTAAERLIILGTTAVETSVTIPSVSVVVDSGVHNQLFYDSGRKTPSLEP
jgi:hypothetical protein